jgi:hypothetical protein
VIVLALLLAVEGLPPCACTADLRRCSPCPLLEPLDRTGPGPTPLLWDPSALPSSQPTPRTEVRAPESTKETTR